MGVPENQRGVGKLAACKKAHDLCVHTLRITSNPKIFDPQYHAFKDRLDDAALKIHGKAWRANNVFVNDSLTAKMRIALQAEAINYCYELLTLIDIAKSLYHLDSRKAKYWAELTMETKNLLRAWRESDSKRYAEYIGM